MGGFGIASLDFLQNRLHERALAPNIGFSVVSVLPGQGALQRFILLADARVGNQVVSEAYLLEELIAAVLDDMCLLLRNVDIP